MSEVNEPGSESIPPSPHDSQIRLSRSASTQTEQDTGLTPISSNQTLNAVFDGPVASSSKRDDPSPTEQEENQPKLARRTSKWARQKPGHPEDGWDDNTQVNGSVLDYGSSVATVRRVALPARMVQMKPAAGGSWLFAKTFVDSDFTAAGKLCIPAYHSKEEKNTRDNTYIFYVVEGAVEAKIHQTRYLLAPGGMFMVPRGNHYSISNVSERTAKLVFFQSRQVAAPSRDTDDPIKLPAAESVPLPYFPTSKASILIGLILERLMKLLTKYRKLLLQYYLRTSFKVAQHLTRPRTYILCFLLGFIFRRLPFTAASRINIQIVRRVQ